MIDRDPARGWRALWRSARWTILVIVATVAYVGVRNYASQPVKLPWSRVAQEPSLHLRAWLGAVIAPILFLAVVSGVWRRVRRHSGFGIGTAMAPPHVYLEAFAVFTLVVTLGSWLRRHSPWGDHWYLTSSKIGGPILALLWAMLRGAGWRVLRRDVGWREGAGVRREARVGLLAGVVISSVAAGTIWVLGWVTGPADHRVSALLVGRPSDDPDFWWQLPLGLAWLCLLTPFVEETVYRGLFYRGLRGSLRPATSMVATAIVFALCHANSDLWPVVAVAGAGFAFLREWRNSLVAPMVAHAVHNAFVLTWSLVQLRDIL